MVLGVLLGAIGVVGLVSSSLVSSLLSSHRSASAEVETLSQVAVDSSTRGARTTAAHEGEAEDDGAPLPTDVVIPAIDVHAPLVPLGLMDDGAMELPDFGTAGWYDPGPLPGEDGPAVIAAHLDDQRGPDVFYELEKLSAGDEIQVPREDGSTATFVVEELEFVRKEALPGDRIWAPTEGPSLRLITCGGSFDRSTGHYESNLIVYATAA